jgi:hypothetical protein
MRRNAAMVRQPVGVGKATGNTKPSFAQLRASRREYPPARLAA